MIKLSLRITMFISMLLPIYFAYATLDRYPCPSVNKFSCGDEDGEPIFVAKSDKFSSCLEAKGCHRCDGAEFGFPNMSRCGDEFDYLSFSCDEPATPEGTACLRTSSNSKYEECKEAVGVDNQGNQVEGFIVKRSVSCTRNCLAVPSEFGTLQTFQGGGK